MDRPIDSIRNSLDNQDVERVHRMKQTSKDKDRKFARALKDEMEEKKKKNKKKQDEVILSERLDESEMLKEQPSEESNTAVNDKTAEADSPDGDEETDGHIDLKA